MTGVIRHRLIYILILGVVTSGLSLAALLRALSLNDGQRLERAREMVGVELDRLIATTPSIAALGETAQSSYLGMRGGWITRAADLENRSDLPAAWSPRLQRALAESEARRHEGGVARIVLDAAEGSSTFVVACAPAGDRFAWAGYVLIPPSFRRPWRIIAFGVAGATALLVATSLASVLSFRRQTRALEQTLIALGKDLKAPIARPDLAELARLAEGIERLAHDLLASRSATDRLSAELAQKERLAALGRVAAGVAHEVRNPLAAIKLRLDLTAAASDVPEATRKAVASASDEITRLDRLVSDLLIVAGKQPGPRRTVALGALVRARAEPWPPGPRRVASRSSSTVTPRPTPTQSLSRAR